jgi:hypothetical protein
MHITSMLICFGIGISVGFVWSSVFIISKHYRKLKNCCIRFIEWVMENEYYTFGSIEEWRKGENGRRIYSTEEMFLNFKKDMNV